MTTTPTSITSKDFNDLAVRVIVMVDTINSLEPVISSVSKKFPFNKRLGELFRLNHHIDICLKRLTIRVNGQQVSKSLNVSEYVLLAAETDNLERLVKSFATLVPDIIKCFTGSSGHTDSDPNSGPSTSGPPPSQSQPITKSDRIPNPPLIKPSQQVAGTEPTHLTLENMESAVPDFIKSKPYDKSFESFLDWARANGFDISGVNESYRKRYNEIIARNGAEGDGGVSPPGASLS